MFFKDVLRNIYGSILENKCFSKRTQYYPELKKVKRDIFSNKELREKFPDEIKYMKKQFHLSTFPYKFTEFYKNMQVQVYLDSESGYKYVLHGEKRLYFPKDWYDKQIEAYYLGLRMEQDEKSPHRYFSTTFYPTSTDVFVDVGCAEAMTSLEVVDFVKEVVLLECNSIWDYPLKLTFEPFKSKVRLIHKMVGDISEGDYSTLEDVLDEINADSFFIKMDIEGYESKAIKGAKRILVNRNVKLAVCTYHNQNDEAEIVDLLDSYSTEFKYGHSEGYMLNLYNELTYPYFRKGILRVEKRFS